MSEAKSVHGRSPLRLSTNALFWIWVAASALWFAYVGYAVATQEVVVDWWLVGEFSFLPLVGAGGVWRYGVANGWRKGASVIDPLRWAREHQVALLFACALEAVVGSSLAEVASV